MSVYIFDYAYGSVFDCTYANVFDYTYGRDYAKASPLVPSTLYQAWFLRALLWPSPNSAINKVSSTPDLQDIRNSVLVGGKDFTNPDWIEDDQ